MRIGDLVLVPGEVVELDWRNSLADKSVWVRVLFEGPDLNWNGRGFGIFCDESPTWVQHKGIRVTFDLGGPYIRRPTVSLSQVQI